MRRWWAVSVLSVPLAAACASLPVDSSPSFCILAVEEEPGRLAISDPLGARLASLPMGERPHEVEVAQDGRTAYVSQFGIADYDNRIGTPGGRIVRVDLRRRAISGQYLLPPDLRAPHGIKLRPPLGRELYTNAEVGGDTMLAYDVRSGRLSRRFPLPKGTHNFVFSPDGSTLFSFAGAEGVSKIDAVTGKVLAHARLSSPVRGLFMARNGILLAGAKGEVVALRSEDLSIALRIPVPAQGQVMYLAELANGTVVAPTMQAGGVAFISAGGGAARLVATGKVPLFAREGPDGLIYVSNVEDRHLSVLTSTGTTVRQIAGVTTPNGLGFGRC